MSDKTFKIVAVVVFVALIVSLVNSYLIISSNESLQEKITTQNEDLVNLSDQQNEQIESLQENLDDTEGALEELQNNLEDIESQYSNQEDQINALEAELDQAKNELEEQVDQLSANDPSDVYAVAHKSVVVITTPVGQGSGFLYENSYTIVTNYHVVTNETEIEIQFFDGSRTDATIIGSDAYADLAVLEVDSSPQEAQPLEFSAQTVSIGQQVVAIGNPMGSTDSLSVGYISQVNKLIDIDPIIIPVYQLDLTITFGNSGGPLLNMNGNVIGVTNAGTSYGLNYAVPLNILQRVVPALISEGEYKHPYVGIIMIPLTPSLIDGLNISNVDRYQNGLLVLDVQIDYPADQARLTPVIYEEQGILASDIILAVNGHELLTIEDWSEYVEAEISPDETITLTVWRTGQTITVELTTTERPPYP